MNIIIEGLDCTYKSTVANKLSKKINFPVLKGSSFELSSCSNSELYAHFLELTALEKSIIDRSIYSNLVYASLYDGYAMITEEQRAVIENRLRSNSLVVYLTASIDTIVDRLNERGDEYIVPNKVGEIVSKYNEIMSSAVKNDIRVHTFDTGILSSNDVVEQVIELLDIQSPYVSCAKCHKTILKKNALFSETHCFSCYTEIMKDLFRKDS